MYSVLISVCASVCMQVYYAWVGICGPLLHNCWYRQIGLYYLTHQIFFSPHLAMISEIERKGWLEADTFLKRVLSWCFFSALQNNNCNTLDLCVRFNYLAWTQATSSCTDSLLNLFSFLFLLFLFSDSHWLFTPSLHVFFKMQVKFLCHLLKPPCPYIFQQCFEVYLHCGWLPGALSLPLYSFYHSYFSFPPLDSFSSHLSDFSSVLCFFSSFHSFLFCLWAENGLKWMRSWRAVNTVIIWLLPALLTAEDALPMATLYFIISVESPAQ